LLFRVGQDGARRMVKPSQRYIRGLFDRLDPEWEVVGRHKYSVVSAC